MSRLSAVGAAVFIAAACQPTVQPVPLAARLERGAPCAGAAALADAFYGPGSDPKAWRASSSEVLAGAACALAHEVAGYQAELRADPRAAWQHFMLAAFDADSELGELYLAELANDDRTVGEEAASVPALQELSAAHPRPNVRAAARRLLARTLRHLGRAAEAEAVARAPGALDDWLLLGAFNNDQGKGFYAEYAAERGIDLDASAEGKVVPVRWRRARPDWDGSLALASQVTPSEYVAVYLATWVHSARTVDAVLRAELGDAARVWVNGAPVFSEERIEGGALELPIPAPLRAGWNQILVKSAHRRGPWRFAARLTDGSGEPLAFAAASTPHDPVPVQAGSAAAVPYVPPAVEALPAGPRRDFLSSRYALLSGRTPETVAPLEAMLGTAADNPLAVYHTALAYWDNNELGKAIDMLGDATGKWGDELPQLHVMRGRYYRQKKQWDKAIDDLQAAVAANPTARYAFMQLAELYEERGWTHDRCTTLSDARGRWPDSTWILDEAAECELARGYVERATDLLRAARAIAPGDLPAMRQLTSLAERKDDLAGALALVTAQRRLSPVRVDLMADAAELHRRLGDVVAARAELDQATGVDPDWPRPFERRAELAWEAGDRDGALASWQEARRRDPKNAALGERLAFLAPQGPDLVESLAPTAAAIDALVAQAGTVEALPGAQTIMLLDHEVTQVAADGSSKRVVTDVSLVVNEQGRDAATSAQLPSRGARRVLLAYAVSKRGERQEASSLQGDVLRFRQLEVGSVVVLQYVHYAAPAPFLPNHFASSWKFQGVRRQAETSQWTLVLDPGRRLHVRKEGAIDDQTSERDGKVIRTFTARHLPPLLEEPFMPPALDLLARVSVSTVDSWDEYVRWERALLSDAFRSSPALDDLVAQQTQGAETPRAKLDRLYHFAAKEIRYQQEYETTIAGVMPHSCPVVLERGYGDCKDKAVLLIRLAKTAGLTVQLALLRTSGAGAVEADIPNQQFNHAIVYVPAQPGIAEPFFMDPTTDLLDMGNLRADDQGALSLVLDAAGDGYQFIPIPWQAPAVQFSNQTIRVRVTSPTSASATADMTLRGGEAAGLRVLLRNKEQARKGLQSYAANILFAGAVLSGTSAENDADIWAPLKLHLDLDVSAALRPYDKGYRLDLPAPVSFARSGSLPSRTTPVRLGPPAQERLSLVVELPAGFKATHLPAPFEVRHACFTASRVARAVGSSVEVSLAVERTCPQVELDAYPDYRRAIQEMVSQLADHLAFTAR